MEYENYSKIIEAIMNLYEYPESPIHTDIPVNRALIIPVIEGKDLIISVKLWNSNGYIGEVELQTYPDCEWSEERIITECSGWKSFVHSLYIEKFNEEIDKIDTWEIESL